MFTAYVDMPYCWDFVGAAFLLLYIEDTVLLNISWIFDSIFYLFFYDGSWVLDLEFAL